MLENLGYPLNIKTMKQEKEITGIKIDGESVELTQDAIDMFAEFEE